MQDYAKSMWISGNLVVVATDDGHIYAYDSTSGIKRWVTSLNKYITNQKNDERIAAILNVMVINSNIAVFINCAMVMGLIPAAGVALPLMSYGGTNLIVTSLALGLVINIYLNNKHYQSY